MSVTLYVAVLLYLVDGYNNVQSVPTSPQTEKFSFDDIFDPSFKAKGFSPIWIAGTDDFLYRSSDTGAVMRHNASADIDSDYVFIKNSTFNELQTGTYFVSPDLQYVLFAYNISSQWRHSFNAWYKILHVSSEQLTDFPNGDLSGKKLQYAGWSASGNASSFVYGNNLYYQSSPTSTYVQLTSDGDDMYIFNGIPDWLYEEDVLSERVSHYWSPDNRYICYARLDDTGVPLQEWPWYGSKSDVFGTTIKIAYPKAGDVRNGTAGPTTKVKLFVFDIDANFTKVVPPPTLFANVDHYYLQVSWRDKSHVYVTWANRVQNHSISAIYDVNANASEFKPVENLNYQVKGGWVEVPPPRPWFIDNGTRYFTVHPHTKPNTENGTSDPWRHLALVTSPVTGDNSNPITFLMEGNEEVQYVVGYDEILRVVYYISTWGDPTERHIVSLRVGTPDSNDTYPTPDCLTCGNPPECRYSGASFSSTGHYYFENCLGPEVPTYTLKSLVPGKKSKEVIMENNDLLRSKLATKALPKREFFKLEVGNGFSGRGEIFIPPDYVAGEKLPLLVYAYAGPGSQRVMKTFPIGGSTTNWLLHLKSYYRVVVASFDGRGSSANGDKLKFQMYRRLGTVEVEDQIMGGDYMKGRPEVNATKNSAIFGWSYGGGTAAHVMGSESKTYQCGVSVAPVATKMYYDTAYTERYLGMATPDDDEAGYNGTDVINKVANFKDKKFLIAHGIADDNVHYMHAAQLIRALENADILFRQLAYPDQNHFINNPGQSRHLYHTMTDFLINDCWDGLKKDDIVSSATKPSIFFLNVILIFIGIMYV